MLFSLEEPSCHTWTQQCWENKTSPEGKELKYIFRAGGACLGLSSLTTALHKFTQSLSFPSLHPLLWPPLRRNNSWEPPTPSVQPSSSRLLHSTSMPETTRNNHPKTLVKLLKYHTPWQGWSCISRKLQISLKKPISLGTTWHCSPKEKWFCRTAIWSITGKKQTKNKQKAQKKIKQTNKKTPTLPPKINHNKIPPKYAKHLETLGCLSCTEKLRSVYF